MTATPTPPAAPRPPADRGRTTTIAGLCIAGGGLLVGLIFGVAVGDGEEDDPALALSHYAERQRRLRATDLGLPGYQPDPDTDYPAVRFAVPDPPGDLDDDLDDDLDVVTRNRVLLDESDLVALGRVAGNDDDEDGDDDDRDDDVAAAADPSVSMGDVTAPAGADLDDITDRLESHLGELRLCYRRMLDDEPDLAGTVEVTLLVGRSGSVLHRTAVTGSVRLRACVESVDQGLDLPPGRDQYEISYPLVFAPS